MAAEDCSRGPHMKYFADVICVQTGISVWG
uniref:Uncharacterized protein n=1 Tax=Anguilla anguilla TaxID=7936 RepID=A0A0E9T590_ANGAN